MVSIAGDALVLISTVPSTVLVKRKSEIISESNFPFENLIRYKATYSCNGHYLATAQNDFDDISLTAG
jgi:hypothetical protein